MAKPGPRSKALDWMETDRLILLQGWAMQGLTDDQIAEKIGVSHQTLTNWKNKYPAILAALKNGKELVDNKVENKLLQRALGYDFTETTIKEDASGKYVTTTTKHMAPDVTAQIFWLKNRRRESWRDNERTEIERERLALDKKRVEAELARAERKEQGEKEPVKIVLDDDVDQYSV